MATAVKIDSRKFLGAINDSAQAQVTFFEERISSMGKHAGRNYKLVALHPKSLYFEDTDKNEYFIAEHTRDKGGRVNISNIRQVQVVEEEKQSLFSESCLRLVNAIEENDQRGMNSAFKRMQAQRFSGRVVPHSGVIRGRDNITRHITISNGASIDENVKSRLVTTIVEGLRDRVIIENGEVVSGTFTDGHDVRLPVTKWASRKLVARRMRDTASNAYFSEGFQRRIHNLAGLVSEGKISEAVKSVSGFLDENEEFTLLSRKQVKTLIENALAASAIFNDQLATDVSTLFHRTNIKVNRGKIVSEWRNIARKSEQFTLNENVQILENSKNFEEAYDRFLQLIFEAFSNKQVAASALATALGDLRNRTPKIRESHDLAGKLDNLIARLQTRDFDDAAIYEAEDLIATIQEELAATDTLSNFDTMPGDNKMSGGGAISKGEGGGQPVININSPLIQIGGKSSAAGEGEEGLDDLGLGEEDEDDISSLLGDEEAAGTSPAPGGAPGGAPPAPAGGAPPAPGTAPTGGAPPRMESFGRRRKPLNESRPVHYEMRDEDDDDEFGEDDYGIDESHDPYAFKPRSNAGNSSLMSDYGAPAIADKSTVQKVVKIMDKLALEHNLKGQALHDNLADMAKAAIKAVGLRVPQGRMNNAIEECVESFISESSAEYDTRQKPKGPGKHYQAKKKRASKFQPWEKAKRNEYGKSRSKAFDKPWEDEDDEDFVEDQFKGPRIRGRGLKKTSHAPREIKNESIQWHEKQEDGIMGSLHGVNFILDHGGDSNIPPVILSEDGSVELPIPEELRQSAYASAGMANGDGKNFKRWLSESIEQLRLISDDEDNVLDEAVATITTTDDGGISVEVSGDVEVDEIDDEDTDSMSPVDSIETTPADLDAESEDEMPDFEGEDLDMEDEDLDDLDDLDDEDGGMEGLDDEDMEDLDDEDLEDEDMDDDMGGLDDMESEDDMDDEDMDDDEMLEDRDITEPRNSKYNKHVKGNLRDMPTHKLPKKSDDKLDSIGPDLKNDDGSGTKPPTARTMSHR